MSRPLISIITPSLNTVGTLAETLESVRAQGLGDGLEHIVVDGGSTDGTVELLERAGVRFVSDPDRGLSDAVNKGLAMASGEIVGWLNADDYYMPGALHRVREAFYGAPLAPWLIGRCRIIDANGDEIRRAVTAYKNLLLRAYSFPLLLTQNFVPAPSTFVRRWAYDAVGRFDERFHYSMDYDFWLRLARVGTPVRVHETLAAFRMAEGSLSMSGFERQFEEHAQNAREHGDDHPLAVAMNATASRAIVLAYRALRERRAKRA